MSDLRISIGLLVGALLGAASWGVANDEVALELAAVAPEPHAPSRGTLEQVLRGCLAAGAPCSWERTYGGPAEDKAYAVIGMPDDGALVVGNTGFSGSFGFDARILRLDRRGDLLWERRYGGRGNDQVYAAGLLPEGVVVAGHTRSRPRGDSDLWVFLLDDGGEQLWQRVLGGPGDDRARGVFVTGDGAVLVAGKTNSPPARATDGWLLKLRGNGEMAWERRLGGEGDDGLFAVAADGEGILAVGYTQGGNEPDYDLWVVCLDADGQTRWERRIHRRLFDAATSVVSTTDGGAIVAGVSSEDAFRGDDAWVLRLDRDGEVVWEEFIGGPEPDGAWALVALRDDHYFVTVGTQSLGLGSMDARVLRLNGDGDLMSDRVYGHARWDRPTSADLAANGDVLIAGYTTSQGVGYEDFWVLRIPADDSLAGYR